MEFSGDDVDLYPNNNKFSFYGNYRGKECLEKFETVFYENSATRFSVFEFDTTNALILDGVHKGVVNYLVTISRAFLKVEFDQGSNQSAVIIGENINDFIGTW